MKMNWNLQALFKSLEQLEQTKQTIMQQAIDFEIKFKNQLSSLSLDQFVNAIQEYEYISEQIGAIMSYAYLQFASDTTNGALYSECEIQMNQAMEHLLFFDIEFANLSQKDTQRFIEATPPYAYYLTRILQNHCHLKSVEEENIILKLSPVGSNAFGRLFSEHFSRLRFILNKQEYSEEEILSQMYHPQREQRKKAAHSLTQVLKKELPLLTYILNMIRKEWGIMQEIRNYNSPEQPRHIDNQTTQKSVDLMIDVVNQNMSIVAEFYQIKKELMGIKKLYDYDRYAPLFESTQTFNFEDSKTTIIKTFHDFSPIFGQIAERAFEEQWIDSHPAANKQGGAFSHPTVPYAHPYILLNHTDNRRDLFTMAHELGHAIHQELSKQVGYLNTNTPLTTSETASVFAEMLLFEKMKNALHGKEKIALYANKIEDIFATLFRQTVFTNFERRLHNNKKELDAEEISSIWLEENQKMFGKSVLLTKSYSLWWSYIPHFIHSPFYCYAYSYGQLLVMSLFGLYRKTGTAFIDRYISFLQAGGSQPPRDLVKLFDFDIEDQSFWEMGIQEVKILLEEFKESLKTL